MNYQKDVTVVIPMGKVAVTREESAPEKDRCKVSLLREHYRYMVQLWAFYTTRSGPCGDDIGKDGMMTDGQ